MPRLASALLLLLLLAATTASEDQAAKEKAVRMKTTRQLKEILAELKIKVPPSADKAKLQALALKHDAIAKWEELHPEKKKKKKASRGGPRGWEGGETMADRIFPMMDQDGDDRLSLDEFLQGGGPADEGGDSHFVQMDSDGDGFVSRDEINAFFDNMQEQMGGMGGGGGMDGPVPGAQETDESVYDDDVIDDPDDVSVDDSVLPSHSEL